MSTATAPARYLTGIVLSTTGTSAVIELGDDTTATIQKLRHVTIAAGDAVLIAMQGSARWIVGALGSGPAPAAPDDSDQETAEASDLPASGSASVPSKPATAKSGSETFPATFTGTYRDGWRGDTSDLYQGDYTGRGRNYGAAYYGRGPRALPGSLTDAYVRLWRDAGGSAAAQRVTIRLLAGTSRPAGAPTVLDTTAGPSLKLRPLSGGSRAYTNWHLPSSWLTQLQSGTAGGIGIGVEAREPYVHLSGTGAGMDLRLYWTET